MITHYSSFHSLNSASSPPTNVEHNDPPAPQVTKEAPIVVEEETPKSKGIKSELIVRREEVKRRCREENQHLIYRSTAMVSMEEDGFGKEFSKSL